MMELLAHQLAVNLAITTRPMTGATHVRTLARSALTTLVNAQFAKMNLIFFLELSAIVHRVGSILVLSATNQFSAHRDSLELLKTRAPLAQLTASNATMKQHARNVPQDSPSQMEPVRKHPSLSVLTIMVPLTILLVACLSDTLRIG